LGSIRKQAGHAHCWPPAPPKPPPELTQSPKASEPSPPEALPEVPEEEPTPGASAKPSSDALGKALEQAGEVRPPNSDAHHIAAGKKKVAEPARKILEQYGIGINDAENGVFLPAEQHGRLHTN